MSTSNVDMANLSVSGHFPMSTFDVDTGWVDLVRMLDFGCWILYTVVTMVKKVASLVMIVCFMTLCVGSVYAFWGSSYSDRESVYNEPSYSLDQFKQTQGYKDTVEPTTSQSFWTNVGDFFSNVVSVVGSVFSAVWDFSVNVLNFIGDVFVDTPEVQTQEIDQLFVDSVVQGGTIEIDSFDEPELIQDVNVDEAVLFAEVEFNQQEEAVIAQENKLLEIKVDVSDKPSASEESVVLPTIVEGQGVIAQAVPQEVVVAKESKAVPIATNQVVIPQPHNVQGQDIIAKQLYVKNEQILNLHIDKIDQPVKSMELPKLTFKQKLNNWDTVDGQLEGYFSRRVPTMLGSLLGMSASVSAIGFGGIMLTGGAVASLTPVGTPAIIGGGIIGTVGAMSLVDSANHFVGAASGDIEKMKHSSAKLLMGKTIGQSFDIVKTIAGFTQTLKSVASFKNVFTDSHQKVQDVMNLIFSYGKIREAAEAR